MLTLQSGSVCDVCAEEYGSQCQPHSIPCGHVLCASCCSTIVEKTPSRLSPACPFCRENFAGDSVRLIRFDFATSGWSTPRRIPPPIQSNQSVLDDVWAKKTERLLAEPGLSRIKFEARRLEDKVAKVATKKCSVEEVSALHHELEEWLAADQSDDNISLFLSAALLRAILMNHLAHSEASKNAKNVENSFKSKLDDLESELRKLRTQYTQKSQDYQSTWTELNRLKASVGMPADAHTNSSPTPTPPSTSPVPSYSPTTPVSRFNSLHGRSASMSSRPSTPATPSPSRSHTPAPLRTTTPAPPLSRTTTPVPPFARIQTPALPTARSHTPSVRSHTPAPSAPLASARHAAPLQRTTTPAPPPPIPPKPRRLSTPSPPKMMRSASEEKAEVHERWIPPLGSFNEASGKPSRYMAHPPSRMAYSSSAAAAARLREVSPS